MKGGYASDVKLLGLLPGHTRRAVAIDQGEGLGIQNDQGRRTLANCKSSQERRYLHIFKRIKLQTLLLSVRIRIYKRMYLQMHLFGVVFHSGPV